MKRILENLLFIVIFIGFPILASAIVEILANLISMEMIINTLGIFLIFAIIYIIKE